MPLTSTNVGDLTAYRRSFESWDLITPGSMGVGSWTNHAAAPTGRTTTAMASRRVHVLGDRGGRAVERVTDLAIGAVLQQHRRDLSTRLRDQRRLRVGDRLGPSGLFSPNAFGMPEGRTRGLIVRGSGTRPAVRRSLGFAEAP
jgi:hypothetical protein